MVQLLKNVEHVHITSSYSIRARIPVMVNFNVSLLVTIMVSRRVISLRACSKSFA